MKKYILSALAAVALAGSLSSCANNVSIALNGAYYQFQRYYFTGTYAVAIGDVVSDISYWNGNTGHWNNLYEFSYNDTDTYLNNIWTYGYKVADNTARVIKAVDEIYGEASDSEKEELNLAKAEALALRAYANFYLVNIYAHQVKVNGTDFSSKPGIVLVNEPIEALTEVSRSTVGEAYSSIVSDLNQAISLFKQVGDRGQKTQDALNDGGNPALAYTADAFKALYANSTSNSESFFQNAINATTNWSANSAGTLWSTYNFSPNPYLKSLFAEGDARTAVMEMGENNTDAVPVYNAGKFHHYESNNSAYQTNYLINAPEMHLIIAEANAKQGNTAAAKEALLVVAKRNPAITSVDDIKGDVMQFIKEERARELFQEGHRLWDLRRWGDKVSVSAYAAPAINYSYKNYDISELVFPIPVAEINAGFGVTQNEEWPNVMPK